MVSSLAVAETQFTERFREFLKRTDDEFASLRKEAFRYFEENGFPSVRNEDWKYTNVASIAKEDWRVKPVTLTSSPDASEEVKGFLERFNYRRNGFTALNAAFAEPAVYRIPKETVVQHPIEFSFAADEGSVVFPHIVI